MKKLLFLFTMLAFMVACSDDDDNNNESPIKGLEIPQSTTPVKPGASVTIKGEGFTKASEIWFRQIITKATENTDIKATITEVNSTGITFTAPEVYGNQNVLLKENGKEYELGKMTFEEQPEQPEEITILPKKIKEIKVYEEQDYYTTYKYNYNENGTIKEITTIAFGGQESHQKFTYTTNAITSIKDDENKNETYSLENGRAKSYEWSACEGQENEHEIYQLNYNGNYLSTITITDLNDNTYNVNETVSFIGGKFISYNYDYPNDSNGYKGYVKFEYGNQLNNLNIDLFGIMGDCFFDSSIECVFLMNVGGKRANYIPQKMEYNEDGDTEFFTFDYKMNGEYISIITLLNEEKEMEWKFEITYED